MKQKDIERVMAAAWEMSDATSDVERFNRRADLCRTLREVDPHGVYRRGGSLEYRSGGQADEPYTPLRECPRLKRADEAGTHK